MGGRKRTRRFPDSAIYSKIVGEVAWGDMGWMGWSSQGGDSL